VRIRGKGCVCHKEWWKVEGGRGPSVAPNLADSGGAMEGLNVRRWKCVNVKKLKMTEPFLGNGGLI